MRALLMIICYQGLHNGTEVFIINATDPDEGANSFLTYYLDDSSNDLPFTVTSNVINANGDLDYEEQTMYFVSLTKYIQVYQHMKGY